jgi:hypothetical protein
LLQGDTHHVADLVLRGIATLAGGDG